jgi:hypothetical protein
MTTTTTCPSCGHPTVGRTEWQNMPKPRPARRRAEDGRCTRCARGPANGSPREQVTRELVLADWQWLHETGQLDPLDSIKHRVKIAAPRMGMSPDALEQALRRAGIRNPVPPAGMPPRVGRGEQCLECRKYASSLHRGQAELAVFSRRLAEHPDSRRLRANVERMREELATTEATHQYHLESEHADMERTAA